jgi:hypothetical protein
VNFRPHHYREDRGEHNCKGIFYQMGVFFLAESKQKDKLKPKLQLVKEYIK